MKFIHLLSKEARIKLLHILLVKRGKKELAEELGISPASITKYLSGRMHPSDNTLKKMIKIMDSQERSRAYKVMLEDLSTGLEELLNVIEEHIYEIDENSKNEIMYMINNLINRCRDLLKALPNVK